MSTESFFRELEKSGLVVSAQGNYSYRTELNYFFITRTSVPWRRMSSRMFHDVYKDAESWKTGEKSSSDWKIHAGLYDLFPNVTSILHTHPPYTIVWSMLSNYLELRGHGIEQIPIVDEIVVTNQLFDEVIVRNHGLYVLSNSKDPLDLLDRSLEIESFAKTSVLKRLTK